MEREKLEELLDSLTVEEKIGQLVQVNGHFFTDFDSVTTGPEAELGFKSDQLNTFGSVLNTFGAKDVIDLQKKYLGKSEKKIPLLIMADVINGFKTIFPIPIALGCSFDPTLAKRVAEISAKEAAVSGIHVTFSPMVDLVRDARWGRVMESFGEDVWMNSAFASAMVKGYQGENDPKANIVSCVKHFAAYGAPTAGRDYNTVELSNRTLYEDYLPAYKAAIEAGSKLVMTSFNTIDGIPATANKALLRDLLRGEWHFDGVVISDHSAIRELMFHGVAKDEKEAARLALEAGCDIDMMTAAYANHLEKIVEENEEFLTYLDKAVLRVLELKNELGLFENPYRGANEEDELKHILAPGFRTFARSAVQKTTVLLKNSGVLPLNKNTKVALIGPYADTKDLNGMWSFTGDKSKVVTLKTGFENCTTKDKVITVSKFPIFGKSSEAQGMGMPIKENVLDIEQKMHESIEAGKNADIILLAIGEHPLQSGEGGSRGNLNVSDIQIQLLEEVKKLGKPIVSLVFSGRPLVLKKVEELSDAVVQCWFPGVEGGNGIADIIYGKVNPSGKLSMTFPYEVGQCPIHYDHFSTGRPIKKNGEINRFSSRYIDMPNDPLHCFGYGLSYSRFIYSEVRLSKKRVRPDELIHAAVDITNTSGTDGIETVQLYVRDLAASTVRPVKKLKAVKKTDLRAGETKTVSFAISEEMLRFYDSEMNYVSEDGEFEVFIGTDSSTENTAVFYLNKKE